MKIAVIGAGAIGSLVAGYLVKAGEDVFLTGRQDQVDAIGDKGLLIKSPGHEENVKVKVRTVLDAHYDLVIFTVKTQDLEQAFQDNYQHLENCFILTTQNGVQGNNLLRSHFEPENMISSIVMFGATYIKPGEVIFNFPGDWIIGKPYTPNDQNLNDIKTVLQKAFSVVSTTDIMAMKWLKLFVNFNNCIPALVGTSMQETFQDMDLCKLSVLLLQEGVDIIQKADIELRSLPQFPKERIYGLAAMPLDQAAGILQKTLTTLSEEPVYGSILQSIMRRKASEIDFINGEVVCVAQSIREESSLNKKVVDLVHQVEKRGQFFDKDFIKKEFQLGSTCC